ncbi:hypothetical protein AB0I82_06580 [Streptomyces sp. NPDC050315]|uniref:hypothetical protein n=1 Tax=Streptomyces sp. NPDC050315 TaxID=3155039 RepID=UPI0034174779
MTITLRAALDKVLAFVISSAYFTPARMLKVPAIAEDVILPALDAWIATAFAPERLAHTLQELQRSQEREQAPDPTWEPPAARSPTVTAASTSTAPPWTAEPTPPW